MSEIHFVDTTLRDGQMSLWATRMRTGMMLPIAERMDRAGFDAIELMSSIFLKKCARDLKEDPFERLRLVAEKTPNTPLRMTSGRFNAFEVTPYSLYQLYLERMRANGMSQARISDEWNEFEGVAAEGEDGQGRGTRAHHQPHLLGVAQAHRRLLRGTGAPGGKPGPAAHLPEGPGRPDHPGSGPHPGATGAGERQRHPGGVPHPLHYGPRAAVQPGSHQARHHDRQHGDSAAGQWLVQPVAVQRRRQRSRARPHHRGGRRIPPRGLGTFHPHRRAGRSAPWDGRWSTTTANTSIRCPGG